tara:strand:+ start:141 stop:383 length:243 start_codon:yes stop_codon:yes gene_type:complete
LVAKAPAKNISDRQSLASFCTDWTLECCANGKDGRNDSEENDGNKSNFIRQYLICFSFYTVLHHTNLLVLRKEISAEDRR